MLTDYTQQLPEVGHVLTLPTGQQYTLKGIRHYLGKKGPACMLTWASFCAECTTPIEVTSGRTIKALGRRCAKHKAAAVPADAEAALRQHVARKAYGARMKAYYDEYVQARDGFIPVRPTKIIDGSLGPDGMSLVGTVKCNDRIVRRYAYANAKGHVVACAGVEDEAFEPFFPLMAEKLEELMRAALY